MLAWEMFVFYILSTHLGWYHDPFNSTWLTMFLNAVFGNEDCHMFQGDLTDRHLAVLDSPLLSNNLRNIHLAVSITYLLERLAVSSIYSYPLEGGKSL